MPSKLVEVRGGRPGSAYELGETALIIGRGSDCGIVVATEHASRRHAEVRWGQDAYAVRDLGSKNGTTVNGQAITGEVSLREGDEIGVPGGAWVYRTTDETLTLRIAQPSARISVDEKRAQVTVDGREISVTAKEFLALALLASDPGALIKKDDLAAKVWPELEGVVSDDSIEQLISRLRRKLGDDARQPRYLLTVRGLGYRLFAAPDRKAPPAAPKDTPTI